MKMKNVKIDVKNDGQMLWKTTTLLVLHKSSTFLRDL